jgi:hypothetical protein
MNYFIRDLFIKASVSVSLGGIRGKLKSVASMGVVPFPEWLGELVDRELETLSEHPVGVSGAGVGFRGHRNDIFGEFFGGAALFAFT